MKRPPVFVAFMLLLPVLVFCQSGDNAAIRKMLTDMSPALKTRDMATLKKFWADDYLFITPTGLLQNKSQREDVLKNGPAIESIDFQDPKIRLYNNTAVVNAMVKVKNAGQAETINPTTLVMVKTGENWQIVNGQGTPVAASSPASIATGQNPGGNAEQTIKNIEQELLDAILKGDATANEKYMADTYIFTSPDGNVQDKAAAIKDVKSGDLKIESSKMEDLKVMVHGNTAVAAYKSTDKGKYKTMDLSGQYRWTDVFVNQNGKWQLVAGHGTPIMPANK